MRRVNEQIFVGVQIENLAALAVVEQIASIEGLDSIVLGPYDLSVAMGHAGEIDNPDVQVALKRIIAAAKNAGKYIGTGMAGVANEALKAIALGIEWIQCGDDYGYIVGQADALMRQFRAGCNGASGG